MECERRKTPAVEAIRGMLTLEISMGQSVYDSWVTALITTSIVLGSDLLAAGHAILYKRDVRSTLGWLGLILLAPLLGAVFYFFFGINRIHRQAVSLRHRERIPLDPPSSPTDTHGEIDFSPLHGLSSLVSKVVFRPLTQGNHVAMLCQAEDIFSSQLQAMAGATREILLATYIFDRGQVGMRFVAALKDAVERGLDVCLLVDDVGLRYSRPSMLGEFRKAGIPHARFHPRLLPWHWPYFNLRNHRKILVVDGRIGFTGGTNLRDDYLLPASHPKAAADLHFRLEGPCVRHLRETFLEDWQHAGGNPPTKNLPSSEGFSGPARARGISIGPDQDLERLRWVYLGALQCAERKVRIVTPYFLPDQALIAAMNVAALRGVVVEIYIPSKGNLLLPQWACQHQLWQVLERGCRVFFTPPPFLHAKLMTVDEEWVLFGSANWDPRSIRLNFEFNVECHDESLAGIANAWVDQLRAGSRQASLAEQDRRSPFRRLRDGLARLAMPFL
jgi:cardiolipin synthase